MRSMPIAEVTSLKTAKTRAQEDALRVLEIALADAQAGEIEAVAIAVVRPDGAANACWSTAENTITLLGSVDLLRGRIVKGLLDQ